VVRRSQPELWPWVRCCAAFYAKRSVVLNPNWNFLQFGIGLKFIEVRLYLIRQKLD
jgi:hypothetical protein